MNTRHNLALTDFANLLPSEDAIRRFQQKWPGFIPDAPRNFSFVIAKLSGSLPEEMHYIIELQDRIRRVWSGQPEAISWLEPLLLSGELGLAYDAIFGISNKPPAPGIVGVDWRRKEIVYRPQTLLQNALYALVKNSDRAKVCANVDCPAPYFIARKTNQRYCSGDCLKSIQQQAKRDWWKKKGNQWREGRKSTKSKPGKKKQ